MSVTITNNGDGTTTFKLEVIAADAKVIDTLGLMAEELWYRGLGPLEPGGNELIPWDDIANAQKLAMIDYYLIELIKSMASQRKRENLVEAAKAAAEIEIGEIIF